MKKALVLLGGLGLAFAFLALIAQPVAADHNVGPCNESGEPGNSDYAQHHIVPLAKSGGLGDGGHKPGSHQGFSACNPSG